MGASQRRKGHDFERKVAARLREIYPDAKRGFQTRGGGAEQADVIGVPFHVECKTGKTIDLKAAWEQACDDAAESVVELPPIVIYHYTGRREVRVRTRMTWLFVVARHWEGLAFAPDALRDTMVDIDFEDFLAILREREGV